MGGIEFHKFSKIARLARPITITEKVDGTSGQLYITEDYKLHSGSRNRWLTVDDDNFGFAAWAEEHKQELIDGLGPGRHYGEWAGKGIQRNYGTKLRRFFLFNIHKWNNSLRPACCDVVPVLLSGKIVLMQNVKYAVNACMDFLTTNGSQAFPRFMNPEGVVVFSEAAEVMFKKTFENDAVGKGK